MGKQFIEAHEKLIDMVSESTLQLLGNYQVSNFCVISNKNIRKYWKGY